MERHIRRNRDLSRRAVLAGGAAAGASLAVGVSAPAILAETRAPLRIGMLNFFTGPLAYNGQHNWDGMNLYFEQIGWTIAGRKVELIKEDDQANPQVGLQKMRKLVESDKVDLVCGPQGSNVAMAILNYIKQTGTFLVVSGAGNDAITWERIPACSAPRSAPGSSAIPWGRGSTTISARKRCCSAPTLPPDTTRSREFKAAYTAQGRQGAEGNLSALGDDGLQRLSHRPQSDQPAGDLQLVRRHRRHPLRPAIRPGRSQGEDAHGRLRRPHRQHLDRGARPRGAGRHHFDHLYRHAGDAENKRFVADYRAKYKDYPDLFSEYGYTAARVIDAAVKATDGDTADKDKLAEAMAKVAFNAPRGPFRFDPVTHHPIQNVYICEVREVDGRLANKDIAAIKDVRDPGKKET